jgi:hypothetical protein
VFEESIRKCPVPAARPPLDREDDILKEALNEVRSRLPEGWQLELQRTETPLFGPDATVSLASPGGDEALLIIEVKRSVVTRDLKPIVEQLSSYAASNPFGDRRRRARPIPMVVGRYLPPPLQEWMANEDVPYADATGNLRIALTDPAIFLRDVGATKDPWRGPGRPKGNLTGEPPARVIRALVDFQPPYSVPNLIELSGASNGATYRVIDFLEDQALIERSPRGPIEEVRWRPLLEQWAKDYGFTRTNSVTSYLAPRGLQDLKGRLAGLTSDPDLRYALTGSLATEAWETYAPARTAMIYTNDPAALASRLDLREVETGANVLLAKNKYDVVFERTQDLGGVTIAAPSQAAVDLMTGPGRNPVEAEALLDWMERNETAWRNG